jgi:nucleotide-binding universal stress UspA family protein
MSPTPSIKSILVPHGLDDSSQGALDYALMLARTFGARVTVLHAYEVPSIGAPEVLVLATDWTKQIGAVAREQLDKIVSAARGTGATVDAELRQGSAWREVQTFAKEAHVDLVVIGSHGRQGLPHALLGSVAEKVVRTAPCPVLVVRGAEPDR